MLTQLSRFIRNKWLTLAVFILLVAAISYTATHFTRAAITALPKIADNSIPSALTWAEAHNLQLPFTDFESLKAQTIDAVKEQAHYLGNVANFARHASTTFVFILIAVVCAVSIFFNASSICFARRTRSETTFTRLSATKSAPASLSFITASRP